MTSDFPKPISGEVLGEVALLDEFVYMVQVVPEQLVHDEQRFSVVKDVEESRQ